MMQDCPKCNAVAQSIVPTKSPSQVKVFGCTACGYVFDESGKSVVKDGQDLANIFRVATEGQKTVLEMFGADKLDPTTKAVLVTKMLEYGVQMWFDGLKQGILLGTVQELKKNDG